MRLIVETLSPVHIGTGENLVHECDYIKHDAQPFIADQNRCFDALAAQGKSVSEPQLSKMLNKLDTPYGYSLPSLNGATGQFPHKEIREQIKDAQWRPFLPGSSLKGAIRTALLAEHLRNDESASNSKQHIPKTKGNPKWASKAISESFFSENAPRGKSPNYDWMRAWKIGDTAFISEDLSLADVRYLNLAPDLKWKNMSGRNSVSDWKQASGIYAEVLNMGAVANLQIHMDDFLLQNPLAKQQLHWQNIPDSFGALREILNSHAEHRLRREVDFYGEHGCEQALNACIELMKIMEQEEDAIYLQVGWGSGWRGMTGDWLHDANIEKDMRSLYRLGKSGAQEFPKTRRLAVYDGAPSLPFGWLRLWEEEKKPELLEIAVQNNLLHINHIDERCLAMQAIQQEQQQRMDEAAGRLRMQQEKLAEKERLQQEEETRKASMTSFDRELEEILSKNDARHLLFQGLQSARWQEGEAHIIAQHLQKLEEQAGSWIPNFSGSNKNKKKKHERTVKIMSFLKADV